MSRQTVSVSAVAEILEQIPVSKRDKFDKNLIEQLYQNYQSNAVNDLAGIDRLRKALKVKKVLVIAPGKTIISHKKSLKRLLKRKSHIR